MSIEGYRDGCNSYESSSVTSIENEYELINSEDIEELTLDNEYDIIDHEEVYEIERAYATPSLPQPINGFKNGLVKTLTFAASIFTKIFSLTGRISPLTDSRLVKASLCHPDVIATHSPQEWARLVIQEYEIRGERDNSGTVIALDLPIENYQYYVCLQNEIRQLQLEEPFRPTIDLKLKGKDLLGIESQLPSTAVKKIGILGGVGPDSDAKLLRQVMKRLEGTSIDKVEINIYSAPPPRSKWQIFKNIGCYFGRVQGFINRPFDRIYIASNTAHLRLSLLNFVGRGNIVNLVRHIAKHRFEGVDKVGIIGTTPAHKKELYPRALARATCITPSDKNQAKIQQIIDKQKQGSIEDTDRNRLFRKIKKTIKGQNIRHLLLGCTELPMALGKTLIERLRGRSGRKVVDTEKEFSKKIAKDLLG